MAGPPVVLAPFPRYRLGEEALPRGIPAAAQATGWPHCPQNRAPAGWLALQLLQVLGRTEVPHWGQKRELEAMEA